MTVAILPIDASSPAYTIDVEMGGTLYRLGVMWNERGGFWTMAIGLVDDTPILQGIRIVPDWNLIRQYADARLPIGRIVCIDQSGAGSPPTYTDLGERVVLAYDDGD